MLMLGRRQRRPEQAPWRSSSDAWRDGALLAAGYRLITRQQYNRLADVERRFGVLLNFLWLRLKDALVSLMILNYYVFI